MCRDRQETLTAQERETLPSVEDPTPLAQFSAPHTTLLLRGPARKREAGSVQ